MKDLGSKKELAEKILTLAELCRKMETEGEKILPFMGLSSPGMLQEEQAKGETPPPTALCGILRAARTMP